MSLLYRKERDFQGIIKSWYKSNLLHRDNDLPAIIRYNSNNNIINKGYYINGKRHRENGPAVIGYSHNGRPCLLEFYKNDVLHNDLGPAIIEVNNGISSSRYLLNGSYVSYEQHRKKYIQPILDNYFDEINLTNIVFDYEF